MCVRVSVDCVMYFICLCMLCSVRVYVNLVCVVVCVCACIVVYVRVSVCILYEDSSRASSRTSKCARPLPAPIKSLPPPINPLPSLKPPPSRILGLNVFCARVYQNFLKNFDFELHQSSSPTLQSSPHHQSSLTLSSERKS